MRIITEERSWRNFWICVASWLAACAIVWVGRPENVWLVIVGGGSLMIALLIDSIIAGAKDAKR